MPLVDPTDPVHPLAAVTHAAPYDYYRRLADGPPLRFDVSLDCWLATAWPACRPCWRILIAACVRPVWPCR